MAVIARDDWARDRIGPGKFGRHGPPRRKAIEPVRAILNRGHDNVDNPFNAFLHFARDQATRLVCSMTPSKARGTAIGNWVSTLQVSATEPGSCIEHAGSRIWWARKAIASYEAVRSHKETDREEIALHLHASVDRPVADIKLWTAHYEPQITSSIAAVEMALGQACQSMWRSGIMTAVCKTTSSTG